MATRNLTNPDQPLQHGDMMEEDIEGGGTYRHQYIDPDWTPPEPETDEEIALRDKQLAEDAREWRDRELQLTDMMAQTPDYPNRDAYVTYRAKLRDWPSTGDFPATKPTL